MNKYTTNNQPEKKAAAWDEPTAGLSAKNDAQTPETTPAAFAPLRTEATLATPVSAAAPAAGVSSCNNVLDQIIGPYKITGFLGRGGMALVYAARDPDGAEVALKVMQESPFIPVGTLERFRREASASKLLRQHPQILTVYNTGQDGQNHYIAMELIPGGRTLTELLREHNHKVPMPEALRLGLEVAEALEFAHAHDIIHRDLKPGNVLVDEFQRARLGDFGLARMDTGIDLTLTSMALGTPSYMAPEQTLSAKTTKLSDIYSFGVLLYLLLTGSMPYEFPDNPSLNQSFEVVRKSPPRKPRKLRKEISRNLEAVLLTLLAKDPRDRYQTMSAVVKDLRSCLENAPRVSVRVPTMFERIDRFMVRRWRISAGIAALGLFVFFGRDYYQREQQRMAAKQLQLELLAMSKGNELEALLGQLEKGDKLDPDEQKFQQGLEALRQARAAEAESAFRELLEQENLRLLNPVLADMVVRELARVELATGRYREAGIRFKAIGHTNPRTSAQQLANFEFAIARMLAGDAPAAEAAFTALLHRQDLYPALAKLCRIILGEIIPETAAVYLEDEHRFFNCIGLWLAARSPEITPEKRRELLESAMTGAQNPLPWLYYHIKTKELTAAAGPAPETEKP